MARPRATDYDDKRKAILARTARLFAERGYARTSMSEIGEACGISKALFYHYYESKEQLLADMLAEHFSELEAAVAAVDEAALGPRPRLAAMVGALLAVYADRDDLHTVQMNDLGVLPREVQHRLKSIERGLVERFARAVVDVVPQLAAEPQLVKPLTMSLFGMLNWHHTWFREEGPMSRREYADLVTRVFIDGLAAAVPPR